MHGLKDVLVIAAFIVCINRLASASMIIDSTPQGMVGLDLHASPHLGNSLPYGVAFTPSHDMSFDSVSLWLGNYGVQEFYGNLAMQVQVSLYGSGVSEAYSPVILSKPFFDTTEFDFSNPSGPAMLQANHEYYLELWVSSTGYGDAMAEEEITWAAGGPLNGDASYDGAYTYQPSWAFNTYQSGRFFNTGGNPMAFSVNSGLPLPEASSAGAIMGAGVGLLALFHGNWRRIVKIRFPRRPN